MNRKQTKRLKRQAEQERQAARRLLYIGDIVEVCSGPLRGQQGIVSSLQSRAFPSTYGVDVGEVYTRKPRPELKLIERGGSNDLSDA